MGVKMPTLRKQCVIDHARNLEAAATSFTTPEQMRHTRLAVKQAYSFAAKFNEPAAHRLRTLLLKKIETRRLKLGYEYNPRGLGPKKEPLIP